MYFGWPDRVFIYFLQGDKLKLLELSSVCIRNFNRELVCN